MTAGSAKWTAGILSGGINNTSPFVMLFRNGEMAAHVFGSNHVHIRERADNMARALNSHAALVEALHHCLGAMDYMFQAVATHDPLRPKIERNFAEARLALRAAKGEPA